jgi:hypothetical protein
MGVRGKNWTAEKKLQTAGPRSEVASDQTGQTYPPARRLGVRSWAMPDPQATARTFGAALTAAVQARGLDLESIQALLLRRGIVISTDHLSGWQAGDQLPEWPDSLPALASLEHILRVPPGAISSIVSPWYQGHATPRSYGQESDGRSEKSPGEHLLYPRHSIRLIAQDHEVTLGSGRYLTEVRTRVVGEAIKNGADRYLAVEIPENEETLNFVRIVPISGCRRGEIFVDTMTKSVATELLFDHTYQQGETFTFEYVSVIDRPALDGEYFRSFSSPVTMNVLKINFDATELPARCYEFVSRGMEGSREVRDLRLHKHEVQSVATDLPCGVHGVAWEWA